MPPDSAEDDAVMKTAITNSPIKPSPPGTAYEAESDEARRARVQRSRANEGEFDKDDWSRQMRQRDEDSRRGSPRRRTGQVNDEPMPVASVRAGILMMVIAVIWFLAAHYFRWNAFDPPILFFMGIITLVRGVMQRR